MKKKLGLLMAGIMIMACSATCFAEEAIETTEAAAVTEITETGAAETGETTDAAGTGEVTPESIIDTVNSDYETLVTNITDEFQAICDSTGDTYEGYLANKDALNNWYDSVVYRTRDMYDKLRNEAVEYYKLVAATIDHEDFDAMEDAVEEFYDATYEGILDDLYDDIYDGVLDDAYDYFYDGVLDDEPEGVDYDEYSKECSDAYDYNQYTQSDVYRDHNEISSDIYGVYQKISGEFLYDKEYDVDHILRTFIEKINR